jgi:hypothetical protein
MPGVLELSATNAAVHASAEEETLRLAGSVA